MSKTTALIIAATVLLIVALTMGEGGMVSQLADRPSGGETGQVARAATQPGAAPVAAQETSAPAASDWFAPAPASSQPAIPVYRYEEVHIEVPQAVVDPQAAAASEIQ